MFVQPSTRMDFIKSIRLYSTVFYILGLSPLMVSTRDGEYKNCQTSQIFVILNAVIGFTLVALCTSTINIYYEHLWSPTDIRTINFVIICEILRISFNSIQCIYNKQKLIDIYYIFRMLQTYYNMHLYHAIDYQRFIHLYNRKVMFYVCGFILSLVILVLKYWRDGMSTVYIQLKILQIMTLASYLHIIFYVDLLSFHLAELNVAIEHDAINGHSKIDSNIISVISNESSDNMKMRERLRHYKTVHYHLWGVTQRINEFFGWCMVAILLHGFVVFVYNSYWLIHGLQPPWSILGIIREQQKHVYICYF